MNKVKLCTTEPEVLADRPTLRIGDLCKWIKGDVYYIVTKPPGSAKCILVNLSNGLIKAPLNDGRVPSGYEICEKGVCVTVTSERTP